MPSLFSVLYNSVHWKSQNFIFQDEGISKILANIRSVF